MQLHHIPFGLRIADQAIVDVHDVPRGRGCECICPSCHTPLIARQGEKKQWHFAHASQKVDGTDKECQYSFFVSVRLMARQVIESGIAIDLPQYLSAVEKRKFGITFKERLVVTQAKTITLEDVHKAYPFEGCTVDIAGEVNGFSFIIYFTHPNRSLPEGLASPDHQKSGIIEICLDQTHHLFSPQSDSSAPHIDRLKDFLQHDLKSKRWVFHPRKAKQEQQARQKINQQIKQQSQQREELRQQREEQRREQEALQKPKPQPYSPLESQQAKPEKPKANPPQPPKPHKEPYKRQPFIDYPKVTSKASSAEPAKRQATFKCVMCQCQWQVTLPALPNCPQCHSHLYATEVKD